MLVFYKIGKESFGKDEVWYCTAGTFSGRWCLERSLYGSYGSGN